ncbi:MAG: adenylate/guanylate cyclase domain-containing protein [bacterium]|nr:adenylate/guanylate cyclase domain-containing protein [bacterium]
MLIKQLFRKMLNGYSSRQQRKSLCLGAVIGIAVTAFCLLNSTHDWLRFAENLVQRTWMDRYYATYRQQASEQYISSSAALLDRSFTEKVVLVVFDDSSLRSGLRWPISRSLYAELVRKLKIAGAKTIAFDIIFSGPSQDSRSDKTLQQVFADPAVIVPYGLLGRETSIGRGLLYPPLVSTWSEQDRQRRLGFTMEVADPIDKRVRLAVLKVTPPSHISDAPHYSLTVTALAHFLDISPQQVLERCSKKLETADITLAGSPYAFTAAVGRIAYCGSDLTSGTLEAAAETKPAPESELDITSGTIGHSVRQQPPSKLAHSNVPPISDYLQVWPVQEILSVPDADLPGLFGVSINPANGRETPNQVLALVGVNVPGGYDIKMSDVGSISGVSIHANILWNLMQGTFLKDYSTQLSSGIFIITLAFLAALLATYCEIKWAGSLFLLLCGGYWYLGYQLMYAQYFSQGGIIIPVFAPWLGAAASFSAITLRNILVERTAKQTMHNALADVLPVPDIEDWVNNRGLEIGAKERDLTILFSDIRGYTDLSETLKPTDITEMLNTYHEAMGSIFERYGGIIFDYQGDAQMVVFGLAPASQPNHAAAAVKAAAAMVLRLEQLRHEWKAQKRPVFECGIGVCTGAVALGVIGSKYRKQICAIGDPTNTSARMQGKSKELNSPVLMTESTYKAAGNGIDAFFIQSVSVKGKRAPLKVYGVDLAKMSERLRQDDLHLDERSVSMLLISLVQVNPGQEERQVTALQNICNSCTAHNSGWAVFLGDTYSCTFASVFGCSGQESENSAIKAYHTALEILEKYYRLPASEPDSLFITLHGGWVSVRENREKDAGLCSIQGEAWQTLQDLHQKCQRLPSDFIATETVLPALGEDVCAQVISTYKVPRKKQTLAIYAVKPKAVQHAKKAGQISFS